MCVCVFVGAVCVSVCMYAIRILYRCVCMRLGFCTSAFVCFSVCMYTSRILYKCAFVSVGVYVCD